MFCEDPEEFAMINYLSNIYPDGDEHIIDLMVWCYRHRNSEFLKLLEKYKDYEGMEEQMVRFEDIDMEKLKKENCPVVPPVAPEDDCPVFEASGSFCEGKDGAVCDSCGS